MKIYEFWNEEEPPVYFMKKEDAIKAGVNWIHANFCQRTMADSMFLFVNDNVITECEAYGGHVVCCINEIEVKE